MSLNLKAKIVSRTLLVLFILGISIAFVDSAIPVGASSNSTLKWSTQAAAGNGTWTSVTWSPELGKFVAVARASTFPVGTVQRVMSSSNGKDWTLVSGSNMPAIAGVFTSVTWSPEVGLFVAVTCSRTSMATCITGAITNLRVMTSPDGDVWTERATPDTNSAWQSVVWSPELSLFVAVADNGDNRIMTSPDGINWTAQTAPEDNAWKSVTWSPELNLFVAVATSGDNRVMTSPDGETWTSQSASEANTWQSVVWSPELGKFVAVSSDGTNQVMTSANGINWTGQTAASANPWNSVTWSPGLMRFVAVANGGTNRVMTSADGETWTSQAASVDNTNAWNAVTWSPELETFVAVGGGGAYDGGSSTSPRVMTGSMVTASTNAATNINDKEAILNGQYMDDFPDANLFFTGSNVFFRYRLAGSSDPYTETTPQSVATAGAFAAAVSGLTPDNTTYEYKAVVQWSDANGTQTLEGGLLTFTTDYADDDNDGIPNVVEDAAPNGGDANNDGIPDSTQPFVASFVNPITNEYVVLELDSVCQIEAVSIEPESNNGTADLLFEYPLGLMSFTADCGTPGYTTTVKQYYYDVADDNFILRKHNPNTQTYFTIEGATIEQTVLGGQTVTIATYQATDGGELDIDGVPNGTIVDPAGLALSPDDSDLADTGQNIWIPAAIAGLFVAVSLVVMRARRAAGFIRS